MSQFFFSFPSTPNAMKASDGIFNVFINTLCLSNHEKHRLRVIVSELFANAHQHGNNSDPEKHVDVVFEIDDNEFSVVVKDHGPGISDGTFNALVATPLDPLQERGRGIRLVWRLSDKVDLFRDSQGRFCIRAMKKLVDNCGNLSAAGNGGWLREGK